MTISEVREFRFTLGLVVGAFGVVDRDDGLVNCLEDTRVDEPDAVDPANTTTLIQRRINVDTQR